MKAITANEMFNMELHTLAVANDGNLFITYIRVPGGWIYNCYDKGSSIMSSAFVPLNNEFLREDTK